VDGYQRVQPRSPPAPNEQLLVLEGLEVRAGQLLVIVNTATAPACLACLPSRVGEAPPVAPAEVAGTTVEVWVVDELVPVAGLVAGVALVAPLVGAAPAGAPVVPVVALDPAVPAPFVAIGPPTPVGVAEVVDPVVPVEPELPVVDPVAVAPVAGVDVVGFADVEPVEVVEPPAAEPT
jgi:hypothetical protein